LTQLLTLFGFFSLILVAVYWVNRAVSLFDQLIGDGQTTWVFLQMSLLTLPTVISTVLPSSAFVAAVFVANRMTNDSELVVMQATGFSSFRLARPVFYFGILTALMMAILTNYLIPLSRTELRLRNSEISQNVTARFLKDGQFMSPAPGVMIYMRELAQSGELLDLFIADDRDPLKRITYTAQRALMVKSDTGPKLLMFDGTLQQLQHADGKLSVTRFSDLTFTVDPVQDAGNGKKRAEAEVMTLDLLFPSAKLIEQTRSAAPRLQFSGHYRLSWPLVAAVTAMVGFSSLLLGAFSRFGLWRQIIIAVILLIVLYAIDTVAVSNARSMAGGWIFAYAAPLLGAVMTVVILWLSQRPRRVRKWGQA
jgi:lipopolysaccharide export system permease protein